MNSCHGFCQHLTYLLTAGDRKSETKTIDAPACELDKDADSFQKADYHLLAISKTHKTPPLPCSGPLVGDA